MSANNFTDVSDVPQTVGYEISQGTWCVKGDYNRMESFSIGEQ